MICHVGSGRMVTDGEIVGIFDLDGEITPAVTAEFLRAAEKRKETETAADDLPRSFVLTNKKGKNGVIFTRLSSAALAKRAEEGTAKIQ
ncbi:MAG: DUF370 domain-containing protein [Clostridia bacterium]|nr:DUF370 domain-containing protein [Clostridia bacterium]